MEEENIKNDEKLECDLVMKGGIASGIVYPKAVLELKEKYSFRRIGGTSAGAIAAAATAAAQLGDKKSVTGNEVGFCGLEKLNGELSSKGFLFDLFQPHPKLKTLFALLNNVISKPLDPNQKSQPPKLLSHIAFLPCYSLLALVVVFSVAATPLWLVERTPKGLLLAFGLYLLLLIIASWLLGRAMGIKQSLWELIQGLSTGASFLVSPQSYNYGLCSGLKQAGYQQPGLCDWLEQRFQKMAGLKEGETLTFNHLKEHGIDLRMITTCLSYAQPLGLPFRDRIFLFRKTEMASYFPAHVVDAMVAASVAENAGRKEQGIESACLNSEGYYYLPNRRNLPVIFATRLSLSFPILFAAVPLYSLDFRQKKEVECWTPTSSSLQKVWFSDGGLSSNFPITMFDAWFPKRPTFGVSLGPLDESKKSRVGRHGDVSQDVAEEEIFLPQPSQHLGYQWVDLGNSFASFFTAIWNNTQNFSNNLNAQLAGSRDRVVEVRLAKDEGGLNLNMPDERIERVMAKGQKAGEKLREDYNFKHSRWTRLRLLLCQLHKTAVGLRASGCIDFLRSLEPNELKSLPYSFLKYDDSPSAEHVLIDTPWLEEACQSLESFMRAFEDKETFSQKSPAASAQLLIGPSLVPDLE